MHYDLSLSVITRKPQQTKAAAKTWCQQHGLKNPRILQLDECHGWTSFSIFSSYLQDGNSLTLDASDTNKAFKELLDILRNIDESIHARSDWRSLERYMHLETEFSKYAEKSSQTKTKLDSEEDKLNKFSVVHETAGFGRGEDILQNGTRQQVQKHLNSDKGRNSNALVAEA